MCVCAILLTFSWLSSCSSYLCPRRIVGVVAQPLIVSSPDHPSDCPRALSRITHSLCLFLCESRRLLVISIGSGSLFLHFRLRVFRWWSSHTGRLSHLTEAAGVEIPLSDGSYDAACCSIERAHSSVVFAQCSPMDVHLAAPVSLALALAIPSYKSTIPIPIPLAVQLLYTYIPPPPPRPD